MFYVRHSSETGAWLPPRVSNESHIVSIMFPPALVISKVESGQESYQFTNFHSVSCMA